MHQDQNWTGARGNSASAKPPALDILHILGTRLTILSVVGNDLGPLDDRLDDERRQLLERTLHRHTRMLNVLVTKGYLDCSI